MNVTLIDFFFVFLLWFSIHVLQITWWSNFIDKSKIISYRNKIQWGEELLKAIKSQLNLPLVVSHSNHRVKVKREFVCVFIRYSSKIECVKEGIELKSKGKYCEKIYDRLGGWFWWNLFTDKKKYLNSKFWKIL